MAPASSPPSNRGGRTATPPRARNRRRGASQTTMRRRAVQTASVQARDCARAKITRTRCERAPLTAPGLSTGPTSASYSRPRNPPECGVPEEKDRGRTSVGELRRYGRARHGATAAGRARRERTHVHTRRNVPRTVVRRRCAPRPRRRWRGTRRSRTVVARRCAPRPRRRRRGTRRRRTVVTRRRSRRRRRGPTSLPFGVRRYRPPPPTLGTARTLRTPLLEYESTGTRGPITEPKGICEKGRASDTAAARQEGRWPSPPQTLAARWTG